MPVGIYPHKRKERACPHGDRPYCSRGMCKPCYDSWYRKQNMDALSDYQRKRYGLNKAQLHTYHTEEQRNRRERQKLDALAKHGPGGIARCSWPGCMITD